VAGIIQTFALDSYSQATKLTLKFKDTKLETVLGAIEDKSEFFFLYNKDLVDVEQRVDIDAKEKKITEILDVLLEEKNIRYFMFDRQIVLSNQYGKTGIYGHGNLAEQQQQPRTVSGKVIDSSGQPLPGVSIVVKGTTQGTITNADGDYTLTNLPDDATLVFSFVGMRAQEIVVGTQTNINVTMEEETIGIEEVVAIGYGSLQRNRISTSITSLEPQKITVQATNFIEQSLEGQIAGLNVSQHSGAPGGGTELQIRGMGSIGSQNQPLVVIDGIPMQNIYSKERSPLTLLNQEDIASIDVLKGVSASAIYGSRGSNGVIIIETISAEEGKTEFSFSSKTGINHPLFKLDLMNAEEFARWRKENYYEEAAFYGYDITDEDIPEVYRNPQLLGEGTDWHDVVTRVASYQDYNINVTHGTKDFKGFFSMGYLNNQGSVKETSFERITMRANMTYEPIDFLTLGMNINPTIRKWNHQAGGQRASLYGAALMSSPLDGPYKEDGKWERDNEAYYDGEWDLDIWSPGTFSNYNPLYALKNQIDLTRDFNFRFQPYISLIPVKGFTIKSQYNMELTYNTREYFRPSTISNIYNPPPLATAGYYNTSRNYSWQFINTAIYENIFNNHRINVLGGYTMEHYNGYSSHIAGSQFPSDDIKTINAATEQTGNTQESNWSLISYIFRLSYDYQSKYLFTGTIRRDGSSRFGSNNRWGYFPSASIGWNISKEKFFPSPEWLTNLKLRASHGYSGNNAIGNYTWIPTLATDNYTVAGKVTDGKRVASMENTMLSWEKSNEFDAGLDLTLYKGRINFVFDYYNKITEGMLWAVSIPISSGFRSIQDNIGKIQNKGTEFSVNTINLSNDNFSWETDFNISFNRNKVLSLGDVGRIHSGFQNCSLTTEDQPIAMFYGWKHIGILNNWEEVDEYATTANQYPGTNRFWDANDDGIIDERDKVIMGNPHPDFRGGFNNNFKYKNWDLFINTSFAHNFDVYARIEQDNRNIDGVFNVLKEVKNRWKSEDEQGNGIIPASFHQTEIDRSPISSRIHNASFLKVQNINIGYNFDNISFIKLLRLYCSIQNVWVFTNYKYGYPDVNVHGNSALARNYHSYDYPITRTILFGLDLNF
jgi:TonB-dependent starch-binding outer membrane protein SusC